MSGYGLTWSELNDFAAGLPKLRRTELHCHPLVLAALKEISDREPSFSALPPGGGLAGIPVYEHALWAAGYWELREDGTVTDSGTIVPLPAREAT